MSVFRVTAPDGRVYDITAPEGATQEQVQSVVQQHIGGAPKPAPAANVGGFVPAMQVGGAAVVRAGARPFEESLGFDSGAGAFAEGVQQANPLVFNSVGAFAEQPLTATSEILGQQAAPLTANVAGGALGKYVGRAAGAIPFLRGVPTPVRERVGEELFSFLPNAMLQYDEAREAQKAAGIDEPMRAVIAALGGAGAEQFGLESMARRAVLGGKKRAPLGRLKEGALGLLTAAPVEGVTEGGQEAATEWAARQPLDPEKIKTAILGGTVGGGVIGGAIGAASGKKPAEPAKPPTPDPTEEEEEVDVDPALVNSDAGQPAAGAAAPEAQGARQEAPVAPGDGPRNEVDAAAKAAILEQPETVDNDGKPFPNNFTAARARRLGGLQDYAIEPKDGGWVLVRPDSVDKFRSGVSEPVAEEVVIPEVAPPDAATDALERQIGDAQRLGDEELAASLRARRAAPAAAQEPPAPSTAGLEAGELPPAPPARTFGRDDRPSTEGIEVGAPEEITVPPVAASPPQLALPPPDRTATGARVVQAAEGQVETQPAMIFGRATPNGRVPFKSRMEAAAYRKQVAGVADYDVVNKDGKWSLRRRAPAAAEPGTALVQAPALEGQVEDVLATKPTKFAATAHARALNDQAVKVRQAPNGWEVYRPASNLPAREALDAQPRRDGAIVATGAVPALPPTPSIEPTSASKPAAAAPAPDELFAKTQRDIAARAKGRAGFRISQAGSPELLAAHRAGQITDEAARVISDVAPNDERLQRVGMDRLAKGATISDAANTIRAVSTIAADRKAAGAQGDIFGMDDSAMQQAAAMARNASREQRVLREQVAAVQGAARRPEQARKLGVDVKDPEGINRKVAELKAEAARWDNWPTHPDLVAKVRGDAATPPVAAPEPAPPPAPVAAAKPEAPKPPAKTTKPLSSIKVRRAAVDENGRKMKVTERADQAMEDVDQQIATVESLIKCLKG